jgi:hypothetical protein
MTNPCGDVPLHILAEGRVYSRGSQKNLIRCPKICGAFVGGSREQKALSFCRFSAGTDNQPIRGITAMIFQREART